MGRTRKYNTPEEAYEAKLQKSRENYKLKHEGQERKKWGFINTVITEDMVGKTIKELEAEYKAQHPPRTRKPKEEEDKKEETKDETKEALARDEVETKDEK